MRLRAIAILTLFCVGCETAPVSYSVHDTLKNESVGTRPFYVDYLSGACDDDDSERQCRQGIQNALRNSGYRVISNERRVEDYNLVECDLQNSMRTESREVQTVDLFSSIANEKVETTPTVQTGVAILSILNCEVVDALTKTAIYSGTGQAEVFVQKESDALPLFTKAVQDAASQAFSKLGPSQDTAQDFITVIQEGFDDGVKETAVIDLQQAIDAAKVAAVRANSGRVVGREVNEETFTGDGDQTAEFDENYSSSTTLVTDGSIVAAEVVEDRGYTDDGRYAVKVRVTLLRN